MAADELLTDTGGELLALAIALLYVLMKDVWNKIFIAMREDEVCVSAPFVSSMIWVFNGRREFLLWVSEEPAG